MNQDFYTFKNALTEELIERMGENVKIDIHETIKNNGVTYYALALMNEESNISPNIRLDEFFEAYNTGAAIGEIADKIESIYENSQKQTIDISFFTDFNLAKNHIYFKIIDFNKNQKRLESIPYKQFLDLAVTYYFHLEHKDFCGQNASIQIDYSHLKLWKISEEELHKIALRNAIQNMPAELKSMSEIVYGMLKGSRDDFEDDDKKGNDIREELDRISEVAPMYVLSNEKNFFGASCLYYPGVLRQISHEFGKNLLILPSSVHEVIVLPENGQESYASINAMIEEINSEQVADEEVLSNHLYYYDASMDEVINPIAIAG